MTNFQAVFYRDPPGGEPVREALDALEDDTQAVIEHQIGRLNLLSDAIPHLPFPRSSQVDGELRELRCHHGRQLYRILYPRSARLLILLHIFAKRSTKIEQREIDVANERWEDFRVRMDTQPRVPPRAAGRDAL